MTDTPNADPLREARQKLEWYLDEIVSLHPNDYRQELDAVIKAAALAADVPEGPYEMDAVDDIPPALKNKIARAVAKEEIRQTAHGVVDHFKLFRAGMGPCREQLNQLANGETDA